MTQMLSFMAAPFAACLVLVGIHAYFGIHVIERRVLFVDLAVAQFAALGAVVGFVKGYHPGELGSTLYSMAFATLAAVLFALTRARDEKLPQEAIIGITFVVASAATILVADRAPEGAEHIKEMLSGSLLWVTWPTVIKDLIIYSAVGLFHWIFRRRFLLIFAYLVIPACIAILLAVGMRPRLILGWVFGVIGSAIGLLASYYLDMPTGPAIVVVLGLMLVAAWLIVRAVRNRRPIVEP